MSGGLVKKRHLESHKAINLLWSIKKIRPSTWTRSSQPSGNGPKSSSGGRVWLGIGLARPVRGSIQEVFFSLWSMKNMRPFGAICIVQPLGSPASKLFVVCELSLVDVSSLELCLDWPVAVFGRAAVVDEPLSAASVSSCYRMNLKYTPNIYFQFHINISNTKSTMIIKQKIIIIIRNQTTLYTRKSIKSSENGYYRKHI